MVAALFIFGSGLSYGHIGSRKGVDDIEEAFAAFEIDDFPVDVDRRGSPKSKFVPKGHVFLNLRHVVSFLNAFLKGGGVKPYFFRYALAFFRDDFASFLLFFQSVHFVGEFLKPPL